MLIVVPAAFLVVLTAVFVRALEKTKQKHPVGLKADKSENEVVSILNNQCPCQVCLGVCVRDCAFILMKMFEL